MHRQTSLNVKQLTRSLKQTIRNNQIVFLIDPSSKNVPTPSLIDPSSKNVPTPSKLLQRPNSNTQSFMALMKQQLLMQKHQHSNQSECHQAYTGGSRNPFIGYQLHYIAEESHQCSQSILALEMDDGIVEQNLKPNSFIKLTIKQHTNQKPDTQNIWLDKNSVTTQKNNKNASLQKLNAQESEILQQSLSISFTSKLIQITSRCVQYYNKFTTEKNAELQIIEKTFNEINLNLNNAFQQIIQEATRKRDQLMQFIMKKRKDIIQFKNTQDQKLKTTLEDIKSVHLNNLLEKNQPIYGPSELEGFSEKSFQDKFLANSSATKPGGVNSYESARDSNNPCVENKSVPNICQSSQNYSSQNYSSQNQSSQNQRSYQNTFSCDNASSMHNYASTLNFFYSLMQDIEKSNFKQMVEQSVNFISNLITEEIKSVLYEKIPMRLLEKRIVRQTSKDFLLETQSQQNSITDVKSTNFNILEADSFSKLFLQSSKIHFQDQKVSESEKQMQKAPLKDQNRLQELRNIKYIQQIGCKNLQQQSKQNDQIRKQINLTQSVGPEFRMQMKQKIIESQGKISKVLSRSPKKTRQSDTINGSRNKEILSQENRQSNNIIKALINANKNKSLNDIRAIQPCKINDCSLISDKQNSQFQIIKKISDQQNDRQNKIKNYFQNFQGQAQSSQVSVVYNDNSANNTQHISICNKNKHKSPIKKSVTPSNHKKNSQRKASASSLSGNCTSSIPCPSLKTSRNAIQVSEFKIASSRKNSIGFK